MIELVPHDMAHGGEAVARHEGKAYFVAGALPGERVTAEVVQDKGSWARMRLEDVLEASDRRVAPPCPHFASCGGCGWQYAAYEAQLEWKRSILAGQLAHLGGLDDAEVRETVATGPEYRYRNRMDFSVADGRPALYEFRAKTLVPLDTCLLLAPPLEDLFKDLGDLHGVKRVTLRAGIRTGERLIALEGTVPQQAGEWDARVVRLGRGQTAVISGRGDFHEEVAGARFRVSARSFFQGNTDGADALVALVDEALQPEPDDTLLDAYAGVGLFAATVGKKADRVVAVESSGAAVSDLRHNLRQAGIDGAVHRGKVEDAMHDVGEYWDLAVCDPPRQGLGRDGVAAVTAARPRRLAYVSCDPASLARDARLLTGDGYELLWAAPVDMFPQTYHIETVACFERAAN